MGEYNGSGIRVNPHLWQLGTTVGMYGVQVLEGSLNEAEADRRAKGCRHRAGAL